MWVTKCGSPDVGIDADLRRKTRSLLHKTVKQCKSDKDRILSETMDSYLKNDNYFDFWNSVKNLK